LVDQVAIEMKKIPTDDVLRLDRGRLTPLIHRETIMILDLAVDKELGSREVALQLPNAHVERVAAVQSFIGLGNSYVVGVDAGDLGSLLPGIVDRPNC
jgi:hypothetical protein